MSDSAVTLSLRHLIKQPDIIRLLLHISMHSGTMMV